MKESACGLKCRHTTAYDMSILLWTQIIHGHRTASISPKIVRFYAARTAARLVLFLFCKSLDIVRCPVKFRYCLNFHGNLVAFCRVINGKMTLVVHRTLPGRRPDGVCTHLIRSETLLYVRGTLGICCVRSKYADIRRCTLYAEANLMIVHVQNLSAYASKYYIRYACAYHYIR